MVCCYSCLFVVHCRCVDILECDVVRRAVCVVVVCRLFVLCVVRCWLSWIDVWVIGGLLLFFVVCSCSSLYSRLSLFVCFCCSVCVCFVVFVVVIMCKRVSLFLVVPSSRFVVASCR